MEINNILDNFKTYKEILFSEKIELSNRTMYFVYETSIIIIKNSIKNVTLNPLGVLIKQDNDSNYIKFFKKEYEIRDNEIIKKFEKEEN